MYKYGLFYLTDGPKRSDGSSLHSGDALETESGLVLRGHSIHNPPAAHSTHSRTMMAPISSGGEGQEEQIQINGVSVVKALGSEVPHLEKG